MVPGICDLKERIVQKSFMHLSQKIKCFDYVIYKKQSSNPSFLTDTDYFDYHFTSRLGKQVREQ